MFVGAASNIKPTPVLLEAWASLRLDPSVRALQIQVKGEAMELVRTLPKQGSAQQDFERLRPQGLLAPAEACFLLFAVDAAEGAGAAAGAGAAPAPPSWALISYIPVGAAVRHKMLYSSSLHGLKQALGPFGGVYSADEEATYEGLMDKASLSGSSGRAGVGHVAQQLKGVQTWGGGSRTEAAAADAPLTELEKLKLAERHLEKDSRVRLPGLKAGAPFTLHDDVRAALQALASGLEGAAPGANWLELSVEADEQAVRLAGSKASPALLALGGEAGPAEAEAEVASLIEPARGRFYVAATRGADGSNSKTLFLYHCPAEAPVREKMGFSVQKKTVVEQVEALLGRPFAAVFEAQELADAASAVVAAAAAAATPESALAAGAGLEGVVSEGAGAGVAVARPRAPGRRGASTRVRTLLAKDDEGEEEGE